ncbi:hypothetical protein [Brevibacillus sp. MER 51]|uniref:hypothetical protein n=1 Tax=Brevibacillus sp. MER 51 TaxID=2939560 RepID=UPI00203F54B5|nr:hypothetical protein [Brevibacillus sp. MER 51]MCM3144487.1 hypothetical protein [Brevibacillus sp. MER 51]
MQNVTIEEKIVRIFPFTQSIFTIINDSRIKFVLNLLRIINAIGLAVTLFGFIFYSLGYSFLYGYYFGGENSSSISTLDMIIYPVPFSLTSVLLVSMILSAGVIFFILVVKGIIKLINDLKNIRGKEVIITSISFVVFIFFLLTGLHIGLSIFFVSGFTDLMDKAKEFIIVWLAPLLIAITLLAFLRLSMNPISSFSGILYGIVSLYISAKYLNIGKEYIFLSFLPMITFAIILSFFEKFIYTSRLYRTFVCFPFPAIIFIVVNGLLEFKISDTWLLVLSIIISIIISRMYKLKDTEIQKNNVNDPVITVMEAFSNKWWGFSILIVLTLYMGTLITTLVATAGEHVRSNTPTRSLVTIKDEKANIAIRGKIVAVKNDIIYISNEQWKLEIIKNTPIRTCCEENTPLKTLSLEK